MKFNPQLGNLAHNLKRAEAIISKANPTDLDLLILPEMAFSGALFLFNHMLLLICLPGVTHPRLPHIS